MTLKRPAPQLITVIVVVFVCALLHVDGLHGFAPSSAEHSIGDNFNVPCKYMDSISVAELNEYARLVGDANWTTLANTTADAPSGYYDYAIDYGTIRRPVARHRRVCVCHRRPCVRLRCARGMTFDEDTGICSADQRVGESTVALLASTGVDGQTVDVFEHFGYTVGKACDEMTPLVPDEIPSDAWDMDAVCADDYIQAGSIESKFQFDCRWETLWWGRQFTRSISTACICVGMRTRRRWISSYWCATQGSTISIDLIICPTVS